MKKTRTTLGASFLALFLLLSPAAAAAATSSSAPQQFNLAIGGGFNNIGQQQIQMSGGTLQTNSFVTMGTSQLQLTPKGSQLTFSVQAQVTGVKVTGHSGNHGIAQPGSIEVSANSWKGDKGNNNNGWHGNHHQANEIQVSGFASFDVQASTSAGNLEIRGFAQISDMVPAVGLPLVPNNPDPLACFDAGSCTSAIPAFFLGNATVTVLTPGQRGQGTNLRIPMLFESAYMNPFGGPIVIESADVLLTGVPSIQIITTYTKADSSWSSVGVSGLVLDPTSMSFIGKFNQTASLQESLFKGTETDQGTLSLFGFTGSTYSVLNSNGNFQGTSTIPTSGGIDCSTTSIYGPNPFPTGTCTETGSQSVGTFDLTSTAPGSHNKHITGKVIGQYLDSWFTPAIAFAGVVQATVTSK